MIIMTIEAYLNPDFGPAEKIIFFIAALLGVTVCLVLILLTAKLTAGRDSFYERSMNRVQRFYEMIISGASVMSFACAYVILNHVYSLTEGSGSAFTYMWENWKDFILLLLICLSCVINTLLDKFIIPLKLIDKDEKASVRMLSMFYVIIILVYLNMIGDESEYSPVMMYYLGLMIGRFVYFDASFSDFIDALKNLFGNLLLLVLGLALTSGLCVYGFNAGYLLERNYFIVGVFYTHLFMLAAVFILHHSHILSLFVKKPSSDAKEPEPYADDEGYAAGDYDYDPEDEFYDYEEYDNEEYSDEEYRD
ncbi:MAG: hypothetical protein IJT24_01500 [Lachnospiraceae bacterium]|nr:hypothetical protein [Lachnospiraceae bacterium]